MSSPVTLEDLLSQIKLMRESQAEFGQKVDNISSNIKAVTTDVSLLHTKVDEMNRIISDISASILWLRDQIRSGQRSAVTFLEAMGGSQTGTTASR